MQVLENAFRVPILIIFYLTHGKAFRFILGYGCWPILIKLHLFFLPSCNVVRTTTHWLTLLSNDTIDNAVSFANFHQLQHILENPILCSTSSQPDLSGLLGLPLLYSLLGYNLWSFLKPLEFDMILPHSPYALCCHTLIKSSTPKSKLLPNLSSTSIRWSIESNYNNPLVDEKSAWKKNKTKFLILLLILLQSPSYTAILGLKQKEVVPGSLIAQGSVTLNIKINPQSKTQINFLFLPYLKNQTKHNYC